VQHLVVDGSNHSAQVSLVYRLIMRATIAIYEHPDFSYTPKYNSAPIICVSLAALTLTVGSVVAIYRFVGWKLLSLASTVAPHS